MNIYISAKNIDISYLNDIALMRGLHALRAECGQLLLTASAHASAYPPGGFCLIGKAFTL